jgi:hypothetical protein
MIIRRFPRFADGCFYVPDVGARTQTLKQPPRLAAPILVRN